MAIWKREWFTAAELKKIKPEAQRRAEVAGTKWLDFRDIVAAEFGIKPHTAWILDYVDQTGQRRTLNFKTQKEAAAKSVTVLSEVASGIHTPASTSKTVVEAWEAWLEECVASDLEFGTVLQRRQHLKLHVSPFIGRVKLSDLTTPLMYDFERKLRQDGRSLAMRRKVVTNCKTMLGFAQAQGWVAQNVARSVRIKTDKRSAPGPLREGVDFPSRAELKVMLEAAPARWRPFLVTAMFTGMRASELRGLTWADVDLDAGMTHVRRRADNWKNMGDPKSKAGKRDIPLAPISSIRCANGLKFVPRVNWDSCSPMGAATSNSTQTSSSGSGSLCRSSAASPPMPNLGITSTCCATSLPACSLLTWAGRQSAFKL
jgi:Phage integrase, N-terminal SAM-like domain